MLLHRAYNACVLVRNLWLKKIPILTLSISKTWSHSVELMRIENLLASLYTCRELVDLSLYLVSISPKFASESDRSCFFVIIP